MKKDFSIHFTLKGQKLEDIEAAFDKWQEETNCSLIDLSEDNSIQIHHCFLTRQEIEDKGFDTGVADFLDSLTDDNNINWSKASETLGYSRLLMFRTLNRLNGVCIFIGDIKDGVKEEFDLATCMELEIVKIPLVG